MPNQTIKKGTKTKISKYMSYLLRHNPKELSLDDKGYVDLEEFLNFIQKKFKGIKKEDLVIIAQENERYHIEKNRIKAIYGHSIDVSYELNEVKVDQLYHGTTQRAAERILKDGLKPMGRKKVHLSKTIKAAIRVGKRRTKKPVILIIDASSAIKEGIKIEKATDQVYLTDYIPPKFISIYRN